MFPVLEFASNKMMPTLCISVALLSFVQKEVFSASRAFECGAWATAMTWLKPGAFTRMIRSLGSFTMTMNWSDLKNSSFLPLLP